MLKRFLAGVSYQKGLSGENYKWFSNTLGPNMFEVGDFWLEITKKSKISKLPIKFFITANSQCFSLKFLELEGSIDAKAIDFA